MQASQFLKVYFSSRLFFLALLAISFYPHALFAKEIRSIAVSENTEIETTIYTAKGDTLFLWLYSEAGPQQAEDEIAYQLVKKNIEVWRVDLFASHFLPIAASSMDRIPDSDFSQMIEYAHQKTGKKIIPVTTGRGSLPLLRGVRHWQSQHQNSRALGGVILMSPKFYFDTPDPGTTAKLLPVVKQTNLPIFILQPDQSPWYWKLNETIPALESSGSDVFVKKIKGVRDRFYFRPDATAHEKTVTNKLPNTLLQAVNSLKTIPYKKRTVVLAKEKYLKLQTGKKERTLKVFKGDPVPPELRLNDLNMKLVDLKHYKGQVVLVNFWASWCPPCVHEMPSMQNLQDRFIAKGFTILGVNMAEDKKTVQHFLNSKVNVKFPILFDQEGKALKKWGVFAFPTSYIIDKKGLIRYAIFGGVDWETKSIVKKIHGLISE